MKNNSQTPYIYGKNPIFELLTIKPKRVNKIYIQKNYRKLKSIDDSAKLEKFMRREEEKAQRIKEREERIQNK